MLILLVVNLVYILYLFVYSPPVSSGLQLFWVASQLNGSHGEVTGSDDVGSGNLRAYAAAARKGSKSRCHNASQGGKSKCPRGPTPAAAKKSPQQSQKPTAPAAGAMKGPLQPVSDKAGEVEEGSKSLGRRADARWDPEDYPVHYGAPGHPGQGYDTSHVPRPAPEPWRYDWVMVVFDPSPLHIPVPLPPVLPKGLVFGPIYPEVLIKSVFVRHGLRQATFSRETAVAAIGYGALMVADAHFFGGISAAIALGAYFGVRTGLNRGLRAFNEITHYEDVRPDAEDYTTRLGSLHRRPITTEVMVRFGQSILRVNGVAMPARTSAVRWIEENGFTDTADVEVHLETYKKIMKRYAGALTPATLLSTIRQFAAFEMGDVVEQKLLQTTAIVAYQELDYINFLDRASTTLVSSRVPRTDFY